MYCLVHVDHNSMAAHLSVKWLRRVVTSAVHETDNDILWNGSAEDGNVRSECQEDEGTECDDGDSDTDW
jgi:hypothetical protein